MIPIGAKVRWAEKMGRSSWVGVVTGHPQPRMVECDGRGAISEGLLEVVGMDNLDNPHNVEPSAADMVALRAQLEGLQAVVVAQAEALAGMVPAELVGEMEALREKADKWDDLPGYLAEVLSDVMGTSNPATLEFCPIRSVKRLAEFVRGE